MGMTAVEHCPLRLAIDEFEEIDHRVGTGQFSPDFPPTLRT